MPRGSAKSGKETSDVSVEDTKTVDAAEEDTEQQPDESVDEPDESVDEPDASVDEPDASVDESDAPAEESDSSVDESAPDAPKRRIDWSRVVAFGVLPAIALLLVLAAAYFKWQDTSSNYGEMPPLASEQHPSPALASVTAAKDSTIAMLSYQPDTVEQQLNAARDLLTGEFRDSYTSLINDVVIPGAKQQSISAVASVPAVASVSADPTHAVVLVFVNQTVVVGQSTPTDTASTVRVVLEKVGDRWLINKFDPV